MRRRRASSRCCPGSPDSPRSRAAASSRHPCRAPRCSLPCRDPCWLLRSFLLALACWWRPLGASLLVPARCRGAGWRLLLSGALLLAVAECKTEHAHVFLVERGRDRLRRGGVGHFRKLVIQRHGVAVR